MNEIKAPTSYLNAPRPYVFLAGSIEMGRAEPWQQRVVQGLHDAVGTLLNPRRDDWDSSWVQSIDNPQFKEQVNWELDGLAAADIILLYFDPGTKSPITLLELGLTVNRPGSLFVCCPQGFWRRGNVEVLLDRYGRRLWQELDSMLESVADVVVARKGKAMQARQSKEEGDLFVSA